MEQLNYRFEGGKPMPGTTTIVGVLSSGNLEVLIEPADLDHACEIEIRTAARGFGASWQAVLTDFFARHPAANIRVSINDAGATPAVVSLRLDQAMESFAGIQGKS